jgi:hypothetical protein
MSSLDLTTTQQDLADASFTKPVMLVEWEFSGQEELLSTVLETVFDGRVFLPGIKITNLQDHTSATLEVHASPERVKSIIAGTYRNRSCNIYLMIGDPNDDDVYEPEDAVVSLQGIIQKPEHVGDKITVTVLHKRFQGNFTPRGNIAEVARHIPPAGTVLVSDKENLELEKAR